MRYAVGDKVEVRLAKEAGWHEGIISGVDDENYHVRLLVPQLLSTLFQTKFKRDAKTTTVAVKKHLETMGIGHIHMRLKDPKSHKPK